MIKIGAGALMNLEVSIQDLNWMGVPIDRESASEERQAGV